MYRLTFSVLLFAFANTIAVAQEDGPDAATSGPEKCARLQASTVFVKEKGKKGSAGKITEAHKNAESQGWDFDEMSLYIEDGDLKGFYVTYTRPHPCNNR